MKKTEKISEKTVIWSAFAVLSAVFLSLVWNNNVWMDEAFSASLVHTDLAGVIKRSMSDTLPPLYNIILKFTTDLFGYSIPVMKITSVIPMIASLAVSAVVVRRRFGQNTALLFMIMETFMPLMLYYGVEIRMYSLGFFFATASGIYAYEVVSAPSKKNWICFTLYSVLAGYSHHFAFVTVGFSYLYMLLWFFFTDKKRLSGWFKCLLATFVLYVPCLIVTLKQISRVSGYFSMPDVDMAMFLQYMSYPYTVGITAASAVCLLMMVAALVMFFVSGRGRKLSSDSGGVFAFWCFLTYYGVLLFGTVLSKVMSANIFVDRYLFFATGLLWLFAAVMLTKEKRIRIAAFIAAAVVGVCTYTVEFGMEYGNSADEEIAFLRENIREGDIYYSIGGHEEMQNCIPFYTYVDRDTKELTYVYPLSRAVDTAVENGTTLYISVLEGFEPSDEDMKVLSDNGLHMEKVADFDFDRYKCEFFKAVR